MGILVSLFISFLWMFVRLGMLMMHLLVLMVRLSVPAFVWMCKFALMACVWTVKGMVLIYGGMIALFIALFRAAKKSSSTRDLP